MGGRNWFLLIWVLVVGPTLGLVFGQILVEEWRGALAGVGALLFVSTVFLVWWVDEVEVRRYTREDADG
jgi:hypothetical protein